MDGPSVRGGEPEYEREYEPEYEPEYEERCRMWFDAVFSSCSTLQGAGVLGGVKGKPAVGCILGPTVPAPTAISASAKM